MMTKYVSSVYCVRTNGHWGTVTTANKMKMKRKIGSHWKAEAGSTKGVNRVQVVLWYMQACLFILVVEMMMIGEFCAKKAQKGVLSRTREALLEYHKIF